jgi:hypothetical protein
VDWDGTLGEKDGAIEVVVAVVLLAAANVVAEINAVVKEIFEVVVVDVVDVVDVTGGIQFVLL